MTRAIYRLEKNRQGYGRGFVTNLHLVNFSNNAAYARLVRSELEFSEIREQLRFNAYSIQNKSI